MPLAQRLPKLGGFKNRFKKVYAVVNLTKLNRFEDGATVEPDHLYEAGLARQGVPIKLLGTGKLRRKLTITTHAASDSARTAIEARGGTVTVLEPVGGGAEGDATEGDASKGDASVAPTGPPREGRRNVGARRASPSGQRGRDVGARRASPSVEEDPT
jgi:hypothetical protein